MKKIFAILKTIVDGSKIGGWVRAGVAVGAGYIAAKLTGSFGELFGHAGFVEALSVVMSSIAVALWSQATKETPPAP